MSPQIGDDVTIHSGAVVVGDIGEGAVIGTNSGILPDVPAGVTVVGGPAQMVTEP